MAAIFSESALMTSKAFTRVSFSNKSGPVFLKAQAALQHSACSRSISCAASQLGQIKLSEEAFPAAREDLSGAGSIELLIGPMFAGKTSALLQRIYAQEAMQQRVLAVKSDKDTRFGLAHLHTHDGKSKACYALATLSQLKSQWPEEYDDCKVIAIDEAQFFPDLFQFCCTAANEDQKHVIVAGLDGDFKRQKFGQILDLVPQADSVSKLHSRCTYCEAKGISQKALFSLRIAADERQEVVGGADKYAPVCRHHYEVLSNLRRDASSSQ